LKTQNQDKRIVCHFRKHSLNGQHQTRAGQSIQIPRGMGVSPTQARTPPKAKPTEKATPTNLANHIDRGRMRDLHTIGPRSTNLDLTDLGQWAHRDHRIGLDPIDLTNRTVGPFPSKNRGRFMTATKLVIRSQNLPIMILLQTTVVFK
jgi:hypothetical protein